MTSASEPIRHIALDGAVNFRDIGGYATADGRHVRWRQLFRSDSLSLLSDADLAAIASLNLRNLFDLRHESERRHSPNRLAPDWLTTTHAVGFFPNGTGMLFENVRGQAVEVEAVRQVFEQVYRRLPLEHAAEYTRVLELLTEPGAFPALIHCTSGKDRTGFAVAIVLLALGVPRETVIEDYTLTNRYRRDLGFLLGKDADPKIVDLITSAHPDFMRAAFESIDDNWGSDEAFLERGLGLTSVRKKILKEALLTG